MPIAMVAFEFDELRPSQGATRRSCTNHSSTSPVLHRLLFVLRWSANVPMAADDDKVRHQAKPRLASDVSCVSDGGRFLIGVTSTGASSSRKPRMSPAWAVRAARQLLKAA